MGGKMKVKILGSNGWYNTGTGNTVCTLIETEDCYIVLDAGEGIQRLDQYVKKDLPIFLFLSHFHLDHISGLHILNKFHFLQPIKIFGQPGTKDILNKIINSPFTVPFAKLKTKIIIEELSEGVNSPPLVPFFVEARPLIHWNSCFGYRMEIKEKTIVYCTDTGPRDNLSKLTQQADILILECAKKVGEPEEGFPHLNPEKAAKIAKAAKAKKLLLTHFDSLTYTTLQERKEAEKIAKKIFPETYACYDEMEIEI